ncbi:hypothetical protein WR25_25770 [Diploscapter pachys]|uniref:C2H2-type domain-containing protein n=1 Tax=Diploscapter pachys TaxID=2018661 RepID=A0A2A2LR19_9BILA|nr:hypothetical protein WR25_25770 [Diploscapter pachys]
MIQNADHFEPIFLRHIKENKLPLKTFEKYVEDQAKNRAWAERPEIECIADYLGQEIHIYITDNDPAEKFEPRVARPETKPIRLLYNGKTHYDAIIEKNREDRSLKADDADAEDLAMEVDIPGLPEAENEDVSEGDEDLYSEINEDEEDPSSDISEEFAVVKRSSRTGPVIESDDEEETVYDDDGNCDNNPDEDGDLKTIDSNADNFDKVKENLKNSDVGAVIKFYDSETDFKNDNAARGLLNMPIPNFCSHRKDDTFEGTIERIDKERRNAQLKNAFSKNRATVQTVTSGTKTKQIVLHPVYDKSNPSMMKYSYGTLTYNVVSEFYHSRPVNKLTNWKVRANFEELMKKAGCPGCDDIGHVIGRPLGGAYDARNLFLQNSGANFNMHGFEVRQLGFLTHKGRSIDYIVEYINEDTVNDYVRYKETVWHLRYHAENGLIGELHFTIPNPRGVKEAYFKKKQEAIASGKYAEPKLEFETYYGKLPSYIMKYNVDWDKMQLNVQDNCKKNGYDTPDFEKEISRNSDGQIILHSIFSNGGKRLEYLYGQFKVEKLFDRGQTKKWYDTHAWFRAVPMKLTKKNALPGDQYGHVLSAFLGGNYEDVNMYPQNEEINMDMGSFEFGICKKIKRDMKKDKVIVETMFNFTYASSGVDNVKHPRPESTNVCLRIKNEKEGKWRAICFDLPNPESVLRPYYEEFARLNQDNFFVGTITMTKEGQDKDEKFAKYGFTVPRGLYNRLDNDIVCPICKQQTFASHASFLNHLRRHNDYRSKDFECRILECTYRGGNEGNLKQHMKKKHGNPKSGEIKRRECDVTRRDGKKCTFYAYTLKEINDHKNKHAVSVNKFKLDCPVSTACFFVGVNQCKLKQHIKTHESKGDPSQAPPSLTKAQSVKEEMFKCPIDNCNKTWTIKEGKDPSDFIKFVNRHLENQHRKDEPDRKFQESELKQLAEEKGIKDSNGEDVKLEPCEKGCLRIFRGYKGVMQHYKTKKGEYHEIHKKGRANPEKPEWTDEEKEILKKHVLPIQKRAISAHFHLVVCSVSIIGSGNDQGCSTSCFQCLAKNGFSFYVARVWESIGDLDRTGIQNIKNAKAAGWQFVDGYIFPCHKAGCASPEAQIEATVNNLHSDGANFGMLWLDIEVQDWPADHATNQNFIARMGNQLTKMGVNWGIYTNNYMYRKMIAFILTP